MPEAFTPEAFTPEAITPEAVTPEAVMPEAVTPEAVTPEAVTPEAVIPEAVPKASRAPEEGVLGSFPVDAGSEGSSDSGDDVAASTNFHEAVAQLLATDHEAGLDADEPTQEESPTAAAAAEMPAPSADVATGFEGLGGGFGEGMEGLAEALVADLPDSPPEAPVDMDTASDADVVAAVAAAVAG